MTTGSLLHPAFGETLNYRLDVVSDDPEEQVADVINRMAALVREDYQSAEIGRDLDDALARYPGTSPLEAIFWYVRGRISFMRDDSLSSPFQTNLTIPIVETLIRPRDMSNLCATGLCRRMGDCDDFAMYTAALVMRAGITAKFATVKADGLDPSRYSHVYVVAYTKDGERVPLDTSHGNNPGWETGGAWKKVEWDIGTDMTMLIVPLLVIGVLAMRHKLRWAS